MTANTPARTPRPLPLPTPHSGYPQSGWPPTFRLGLLFLGQFAIFAVALVVLGQAINWPAVLLGRCRAGLALLSGLLEIVGLDLGPAYLTACGVLWQPWMIATGVALLRTRASRQPSADSR